MIHFFLGIAAFKVVARENNVDGFLGEKLDLEWELIDIPTGYEITQAGLTFNATFDISKFDPINNVPLLLPEATQLFYNRIMIKLKENIYKVTVTNVLFNDTGIFELAVQIGKSARELNKLSIANITISSVIGEFRFPYFQIFISFYA